MAQPPPRLRQGRAPQRHHRRPSAVVGPEHRRQFSLRPDQNSDFQKVVLSSGVLHHRTRSQSTQLCGFPASNLLRNTGATECEHPHFHCYSPPKTQLDSRRSSAFESIPVARTGLYRSVSRKHPRDDPGCDSCSFHSSAVASVLSS
eukprot:COSAG02_NODE_2006_length_10124_cov_6.398664_8_plen_146_part_00